MIARALCQEDAILTHTRPINDRVLVKLHARKPLSDVLIIPDIAQEQEKICGQTVVLDDAHHEGTVMATGPGMWVDCGCSNCGKEWESRRPMSVKEGDVVVFGHYADYGKDGLILIREDDILAVLCE